MKNFFKCALFAMVEIPVCALFGAVFAPCFVYALIAYGWRELLTLVDAAREMQRMPKDVDWRGRFW